jgi:predicted DCC family thiol-disulfide oxidoreductase YuxK
VTGKEAVGTPRGWILYDDSCGFCRRWVPFWENALRHRGYAIAPLQAAWVRERLAMTEEELLQDLRLLLPDGSLVSGADVYRHATKRIWWAWPVHLVATMPGLSRLFDAGYRAFARNRHRVSRACGWPGANEPPPAG